MSIVVREDLSVPISEEMAEQMGLHPGSSVQWERAQDGSYILRPVLPREEAVRRLRGMSKSWLKPGESGVESFLQERQIERTSDESYRQR
ncbi:hypothetical protein EON81_04780 [bacterium]|nr:MAG: hypothetical protein EON81_04780 [bacterium]